jgi:hypothetical protein
VVNAGGAGFGSAAQPIECQPNQPAHLTFMSGTGGADVVVVELDQNGRVVTNSAGQPHILAQRMFFNKADVVQVIPLPPPKPGKAISGTYSGTYTGTVKQDGSPTIFPENGMVMFVASNGIIKDLSGNQLGTVDSTGHMTYVADGMTHTGTITATGATGDWVLDHEPGWSGNGTWQATRIGPAL